MNTNDLDFDEDDAQEGNFLKRNWLALTVVTAVLGFGTSAAIALASKGGGATRKSHDMVMIQLPPPPPVVLPPPPPPPIEEEMIEHEDEVKEEAPPEDTAPSTGVVSNGPADNFGLRPKGGGNRRPLLSRRSIVSTWDPYSRQAASRIADAMRRHSKLKNSAMSIKVLVWIDSTGRITKASAQSTGDASLDATLRDDVLTGMQLSGPPPEGMKMPVNLRVTARRPN